MLNRSILSNESGKIFENLQIFQIKNLYLYEIRFTLIQLNINGC